MHEDKNRTSRCSATTIGRHREKPGSIHVGCFFSNPIKPRDAAKHATADQVQAVAS